MANDLEQHIDALYGLAPSEFVAARDDLAGRLGKSGDGEGRKRVKALRRPTVPAWAVNQLLRTEASGIDELLRTGEELRKAQRRALSGAGAGGFREVATRRRALVSRLTDQAMQLLERQGSGSAGHRDAVAATLEAASSDDDSAELVRSGRLVKELTPPTEFGGFSPLTALPSTSEREEGEAAAPRRGTRRAAKRTAEEKAAAAEADLQAARDLARARTREAQSAARRAERARGEADRADAEASRLEERATQARERHRFLAERARSAEAEATAARKEADAASRTVERMAKRR